MQEEDDEGAEGRESLPPRGRESRLEQQDTDTVYDASAAHSTQQTTDTTHTAHTQYTAYSTRSTHTQRCDHLYERILEGLLEQGVAAELSVDHIDELVVQGEQVLHELWVISRFLRTQGRVRGRGDGLV